MIHKLLYKWHYYSNNNFTGRKLQRCSTIDLYKSHRSVGLSNFAEQPYSLTGTPYFCAVLKSKIYPLSVSVDTYSAVCNKSC
jgi:hypothetical protein